MRKLLVACLAAAIGCGGSGGGKRDSATDKGATGDAQVDTATANDTATTGDTASPADTITPTPEVGADVAADMGGGDAPAEAGAGDTATATDAGTDANVDTGIDAAAEAGTDVKADAGMDSGAEAAPEAGAEVAVEAPPACGANNAACDLGGKDGLCRANVCAACTDVTDDANCTSAYGTAGTNPYICLQGACVPGNCRANADCTSPAGSICGLSKANTCAKCASDGQCVTNYGATFICNTTAGACVAGACASGDNTTCAANAADVCCGGACTAGECCPGGAGDTLCKNKLGNSAVCTAGHVCSTCQTVAGKNYLVDPVNGSDSGSTGSGLPSASCAFKTITHALQFIGAAPVAGTTITVIGGATAPAAVVVQAGETFPLTVPANLMIIGQNFVTVQPPAGASGFLLGAPASGLRNLTIDGGNHTAQTGVGVIPGSTDGTTLQDVDVTGFLGDGIIVAGGRLTIVGGVTSNNNGMLPQRASGLHVVNRMGMLGSVRANLPLDQVAFNGNTANGVTVEGTGAVQLTGVAGVLGAGTIVANNNLQNGYVINQVQPALGSSIGSNALTGVVAWANMGGSGLVVVGGSVVTLRSSYLLSNNTAGVAVLPSGTNTDVTKIDLGFAASLGRNTLQASLGSGQNQGGGICMSIGAAAMAQLTAMGNIFSGPKDCSGATPGAVTGGRNVACGNHVDISFFGVMNDILVANCTHP